MKKLFRSLLLLCLLGAHGLVQAQTSPVWNGTVNTAWYNDSINAPVYYISTPEQLAGLAQLVNAGTQNFSGRTIRLTQSIMLNDTASWRNWGTTPPARTWTAIGTVVRPFQGTFDGQGYGVLGVYINSPAADNQGFFGHVTNSTIRNVGVVSSFISGRHSVGGLVGTKNGSVSYSHNTGVVSGATGVGGLVGFNDGGTMTNSSNTGTVSGARDVGGLVGWSNGSVTSSYNAGVVTGTNFNAGGLVGWNNGSVTSSYNTGPASGVGSVGGLVGWNDGTVTSSYNTGAVSGNIQVGGLVGGNDATVTNSFFLEGSAALGVGNGTAVGATSMDTAQFTNGQVAHLLQGAQAEFTWGHTV